MTYGHGVKMDDDNTHEMLPTKKVIATWDVSLNCDCPHCGQWVDLLAADGFWEAHERLSIPEWGTPRTRNMEVTCPVCEKEFVVDTEY